MKYFAKNILFLREKRGFKQAEMQAVIGINRTTWNNYESGTSKPNVDGLIQLAKFFGVTEHDLLHTDFRRQGNLISPSNDIEIDKKGNLKGKGKGNLTHIKYKSSSHNTTAEEDELITLRMPQVVTIDSQGNENLVLVPVRARAGYLNGYADPDFVGTLPAYRIPGLNNGTFRLFETEGLSMYPTLHPGDLIIGSFVDQLRAVRDDRVHVVVTINNGVVVKRVLNRIEKDGKLILKSDNYKDRDQYPTIVSDQAEILEVWYATGFISRQMRPPAETYNRVVDLEGRFTLLEEMVKKGILKLP